MTTEQGQRKDAHPKVHRLSLKSGINVSRILDLAGYQRSEDGKVDKIRGRAEKKLRLFLFTIALRRVGLISGFISLITLTIIIIGVAIFYRSGDGSNGNLDGFLSVTVAVTAVSFMVWLYTFMLFGFLWPATSLGLKVGVISRFELGGEFRPPEQAEKIVSDGDASAEKVGKYGGAGSVPPEPGHETAGDDNVSRSLAIAVLQQSGIVARYVIRSLRGKFFSATVRPDINHEVATIAEGIMLKPPKNGIDSLPKNVVKKYDQFLRDVTGLIALERIDKIEDAAELYEGMALVKHDDGSDEKEHVGKDAADLSEKMHAYLQPLAGRTWVEVIVDFALPALAFLVSIAAIVVSVATG